MLQPSEWQLMEDTTRQSAAEQPKKRHKSFQPIRHVDPVDGRFYGELSLDTMKSGHKDSQNTRLTVGSGQGQTLVHATMNNRNPGDATRHMGDRAYRDNRVVKKYIDHYGGGGLGFDPPDDTIMRLDPSADLNAVAVDDFQHGGTSVGAFTGTMIGAGGSIPTGTGNGSSMDRAVGLHYAVDIKPGTQVTGDSTGVDQMAGRGQQPSIPGQV